jgi:hypothetical protein
MAKGTIKISHNYLNPYEYYHSMLKGNALFDEDGWTNAYNNGSLPQYISMITSEDAPTLSTMNEKYGYDYLDAERRQIALYNEEYADRTNVQSYDREFVNENGETQKTTYEMTQYEYTKMLLQEAKDIELQQRKLEAEAQAKNEMHWIPKVLSTAFVTPILNLASGITNFGANIYNMFEGVIEGTGEALQGGSFDAAFRKAFTDYDVSDQFKDWIFDWERKNSYTRDINGNYTFVGAGLAQVSSSIGEMLPTLLLSYGVGSAVSAAASAGSITATTASAVTNTVGKAAHAIYYTGMASGTFKELSREMPTVPTMTLVLNSAVKTVAEAGIEMALGQAFGPSNMDKLHFGYAPGNFKSSAPTKVLKEFAKDFVQEGTEELLQELSGYFVDEAFQLFNNEFGGLEDLKLSTLIDAFVLGGISTIATNSFSLITTKRVAIADVKYDSNGKPVLDKKGNFKKTYLGKAKSWLYNQNLSQMFSAYEQAINDKKLSQDQREALLGQMYVSLRTISSFYGEVGQERFDAAVKLYNAINNNQYEEQRQAEISDLNSKIADANSDVNANKELIAEYQKTVSKLEEMSMKDYKKRLTERAMLDLVSEVDNLTKANTAKLIEKSKATQLSEVVNKNDKDAKINNVTGDGAKKVVNEMFNKDPTLNYVVLTEDGERPIIDKGIAVIPLKLADLHGDTELIYRSVSEALSADLVNTNLASFVDKFVDIYKELYNEDNPNKTEVIYNVLFNDKFFNILLYSSNKDTVRFLDSLGKTIDELSAKNYKDSMFKYTASGIYKSMKKQLIAYCIDQQEIVPETMQSLSSEEITKVKNKRYSKDLANRLISINGLKNITANERTALENKVKNAPIETKEKEALLVDLFNLNSSVRKSALTKLDEIYKGLYYGPYNNKTYKKVTFVGDAVFNQFLMDLGLNMKTIFNPDVYSDTLKNEFDTYVENNDNIDIQLSAYNFMKDKFEEFTGSNFSFDKDLNVTTDVEFDIPLIYSKNDMMSNENREKVFLEVNKLQLKLLKDILNPVSESLANYINLSDIIINPKEEYINLTNLNKKLHDYGILEDNEHLNTYISNPYRMYYLLNQYLVEDTNGEFGITQLPSGEFILMRYINSDKVINENNISNFLTKLKKGEEVNLSEILKNKIATDYIKDIKVKPITDKNEKRLGYYNHNEKTIFINQPKLLSKLFDKNDLLDLITHELHHAYMFETTKTFGATIYEFSDDVIENLGEHLVEDLRDSYDSRDLYDNVVGEALANGDLPLEISFIRTKTGVITPWGEQYYFAKSNKAKLITKKDIVNGEKPLYDVSDISAKEYTPTTYRKFFKDKLEAESFKILYEDKGYEAKISKRENGYAVNYRKVITKKQQEQQIVEKPQQTTLTKLKPSDLGIKEKTVENKSDTINKNVDEIVKPTKTYKKGEKLTSEEKIERTKNRILKKPFRVERTTTRTRRISLKKAEKYPNFKPFVGKQLDVPIQLLLMNFDRKKAKETGQDLTTARALNDLIKKGVPILPTDIYILLNSAKSIDDHTFKVINYALFSNPYIKTFEDLENISNKLTIQAWAFKYTLEKWIKNAKGEEYDIAKNYLSYTNKQMKVSKMEELFNKVLADPKLQKTYVDALTWGQKMVDESMYVQIMERFDGTIDSLIWAFDTIKKITYSHLATGSKKRELSLNLNTNNGDTTLEDSISDIKSRADEIVAYEEDMEEDIRDFRTQLYKATHKDYTKDDIRNLNIEIDNKLFGEKGKHSGLSTNDMAILHRDYKQILDLVEYYTIKELKNNTNQSLEYYQNIRNKFLTQIYKLYTNEHKEFKNLYYKFYKIKYSPKNNIAFGDNPNETINAIKKANVVVRERDNIRQNINRYHNNITTILNSTNKQMRTKFMKDPKNAEYFTQDNTQLGLISFKEEILKKNNAKRRISLTPEQLLVLENHLKEISKTVRSGVYANEEFNASVNKLNKKLEKEQKKRALAEQKVENLQSTINELNEERKDLISKNRTVNTSFGPANFNIMYSDVDYNNYNDTGYDNIKGIPEPLREILSFSFTKFRPSSISFATGNNMVQNGKIFFAENADTLSKLTEQDIIDIIGFYKNTTIDTTDRSEQGRNDVRKYEAFMLYLLEYFATQHNDPNSPLKLSNDLVADIKSIVSSESSRAGTKLRISARTIAAIDPIGTIASKLTKISGIQLSDAEATDILNTINNTDFSDKKSVDNMVDKFRVYYEAAIERSPNDGNLWDRLWRFQRMAMLSSPGTGVRNWVSNNIVKTTNKFSEYIGDKFVKIANNIEVKKKGESKLAKLEGQWKIIGVKASKKVENYAETVFVNSGLINYLSVATKYDDMGENVSYQEKLSNLIKASLDNTLFSKNQFNSKLLNKFSNIVYNMLDDSKFVRATSLKYFKAMLQQYLDENPELDIETLLNTKSVSSEVLNIFADAYTLASYDYMHKPNIINNLEKLIREKCHPSVYFAYKQMFPFAASSWNWFVEGLKLTPVGLVKAIWDFNHIENKIDKMREAYLKDNRLPSDSFAKYLVTRDLGKGVIGSIGFIIGTILMLSGLAGFEEDDYDRTLKIKIGDLYIDISNVFGTQSIFLGMAFTNSLMKLGGKQGSDVYEGVLDIISDVLDQMFLDSTLSDVFNMLRYDDTLGQYVVNHFDDSLRMFVPNIFLTASSALSFKNTEYGYGLENLARRVATYLPTISHLMPAKYDPYTGEKQLTQTGEFVSTLALQIINKILPVKFNYYKVSDAEKMALKLGVHKKQLSGIYNIDGKKITLYAKDISKLNKYYGELNANELMLLFENRKAYKVWNEDKKMYQTIKFNKMTDEQKKNAIEHIMDNNAKTAKVYILTSTANDYNYKYYTSVDELKYLKSLGITNVFIESKKKSGFVK